MLGNCIFFSCIKRSATYTYKNVEQIRNDKKTDSHLVSFSLKKTYEIVPNFLLSSKGLYVGNTYMNYLYVKETLISTKMFC